MILLLTDTFSGTVRRPEAISLSSWFLSPLRNSTSQPSQRSTTFFSFVQTWNESRRVNMGEMKEQINKPVPL